MVSIGGRGLCAGWGGLCLGGVFVQGEVDLCSGWDGLYQGGLCPGWGGQLSGGGGLCPGGMDRESPVW